ncbi:helix-turn-helix transcriptional regulator [Microbacterium tumbae]
MTVDGATVVRRELGAFLRSRRERLSPAQVSLPAGGRRRTPGLRREEVATLAGVGVTWYTWLEQGRDIRPSPSVLDAIAGALRLDLDEREHLWILATGHAAPGAPLSSMCEVVTADHLALLATLMPLPACIQTATYDILASNASYRFLIDDLDDAPIADRNCMVRAFLDPAWQRSYGDYDGVTTRMVARLRAAMAEHLDDPAWTGLVDRLRTESPRFDTLWRTGALAHDGVHEQVFRYTRAGTVHVRFVPLWIDRVRSVHIKVLQPVDASGAEAFARMAEQFDGAPLVTARPKVRERLDSALAA